jgi:rSAM/selenodomain-associated transferase 2
LNVTIIIPTLNEEANLGRLLSVIIGNGIEKDKVIVVDGGSKDATCSVADSFGVSRLTSPPSRAKQMNAGAKAAKTEWLYFVHADTIPPKDWTDDLQYLANNNLEAGTYRSQFENGPLLLGLNAFFTRFNWIFVRGGDQSLFIQKSIFEELGGFPEKMVVMEEYPLIEKLYARGKFRLFSKCMIISSRKYKQRSWFRVSRANFVAFRMYKNGADTAEIKRKYEKTLG